MLIETLSVFPQMFEVPMSSSIIGRARQAGFLDFKAHDLRDWTHDRHNTTDDVPYGGGQGQLMKVEPVFEALDDLLADAPARVLFFTPAGERFTQRIAEELVIQKRLIMVCGRYEGFDERVYTRADRCISLGDYVLTGGELAAMVVTDAVCRLIPGVLGDELSNVDESFAGDLLEYPQYTRPAEYRGLAVPAVLLSGDHAKIAAWRREQSIIRTARLRPDLVQRAGLEGAELELVRKARELPINSLPPISRPICPESAQPHKAITVSSDLARLNTLGANRPQSERQAINRQLPRAEQEDNSTQNGQGHG